MIKSSRLVKLEKILETIAEVSLYVLIFFLAGSKSMVEICFGVAFIAWIAGKFLNWKTRTIRIVDTKINLPIVIFIGLAFLSTIFSTFFMLSLKAFFFKLLEGIFLCYIVIETINNSKKINRTLIVMFLSMLIVSVNGIWQLIAGAGFLRDFSRTGDYVIRSTFSNQNSFGAWLVVMIPVTLSVAYFSTNAFFNLPDKFKLTGKGAKAVLWCLCLTLVVCLALTNSRGSWIAAFGALIFFGIFRSKKVLIAMIIFLLVVPFVAPDKIKERAAGLLNGQDESVSIRLDLWEVALGVIKDHPLLGSGLNTYSVVSPDYNLKKTPNFYPHNSYLHMAAEYGLLGLVAFVWIIIVLFKTSLAKLKKMKEGFHKGLLAGLLASLFGFLVHSFVDENIFSLQLNVLMWFIIGLIVAVQKTAKDSSP